MAVVEFAHVSERKDFAGLSTDDKPTWCTKGSTFYETDTNKKFLFVGTWIELV